jgi:hypothetical protein
MEAYSLSIDAVVNSFNFGQIIMLAEVAKAKADDMDKDINPNRGKQLNKNNKEAAEMLLAGI